MDAKNHAAQLIADALEILSPDDSTVFNATVTPDNEILFRVDSDDAGLYDVRVSLDVREAGR